MWCVRWIFWNISQYLKKIIQEAGRLLKPGGLFFFHMFNRNFLSWLIVIKGVEWCVPNTPKNMHLYSHFIKPYELKEWCDSFRFAAAGNPWTYPPYRIKSVLEKPSHQKSGSSVLSLNLALASKRAIWGIAQKKSSNQLGT